MHWKLKVWPDCFKTETVDLSEGDLSVVALANKPVQWHHSFALGFFGFHYIRAAKDQDLVLKRESLHIFQELMTSCNLERVSLKNMNVQKSGRFLDFWNNVIRRVALAIGDSFGHDSQQMVELGFWLAAVYAGLVHAQREDDELYMKKCLVILEEDIVSFQHSDIPTPIQSSLCDLKELLRRSKKPVVLHKCFHKIESILRYILLLGTPDQLSIRQFQKI